MKKATKNILILAVFGVVGWLLYRWWIGRKAASQASSAPSPTQTGTTGTITAAGNAASGFLASIKKLFNP